MRFALATIALVAVCLQIPPIASTFNPYPRYTLHDDGGDPGPALYLTDYIEHNQLDKARELSQVKHPAIPDDIVSYSGYFTVNPVHGSSLFFWYFPAVHAAETAPVVLWLQGGPGASSLFGLFTENGPLAINASDPSASTLLRREYSWHLNHHLIYIDNPVGTGFSAVTDDQGYAHDEKDVGRDLYAALQQFFAVFGELRTHEFYITGESYAGKYVPALGHTIHHENAKLASTPPPAAGGAAPAPASKNINLVGLAMGNGLSDPLHQMNYADYLYQLGLIDTNGHAAFETVQNEGIACIKKQDFECAFEAFDRLINMDESTDGSVFKNLTGLPSYYNYITPETSVAGDEALGKFLQSTETRRAIHVGNNSFHDLSAAENKVEIHLKKDVMASVAPWVAELLSFYKVLIYNGQLDIIVAYPLTENYLKHLTFDGQFEYKTAKRYVWMVEGHVAGYVKHAGNLTEVMVRNAGHMVPADQPKWALDMLLRMTMKKGFRQ